MQPLFENEIKILKHYINAWGENSKNEIFIDVMRKTM